MRPNSDPANQAVYVWSRIDPRTNRLIGDKLRRATLKLKREIDRETNRIRLQNRLNLNKTGVDQQIAGMWAGKIQAHVEMGYDKIYCHHWSLLGHRKTGAFVRACSAILGGHIDRLGATEAHRARIAHRRQGGVRPSVEGLYKSSAASLRKELEEQLEIEARELDLAASIEHAGKRANQVRTSTDQSRNPAAVTTPVDPVAVAGPGEIVIESGPLSAEDADTTAAAVEMLQKLGFGREDPEWPSPPFGPALPGVLKELKRARRILITNGFLVIGDPMNPLGDGRSWVLRFEPTDKLPTNADSAELAERYLQSEGIEVAAKPVQDGRTFLVALWDSGRVRKKETRNKRDPLIMRMIADSVFWRDLAVQFLELQNNPRLRVDRANDFVYSAFETLAKRGASKISSPGALDLLAVWLAALKKEGLAFDSSGQSDDVNATDYAHAMIKDTFDGMCEASATLSKRLEAKAVQEEFEEQRESGSRRQRRPSASSRSGSKGNKKPNFYAKNGNYQTIVFGECEYTLTPQAAAIVRILHESGEKPVPRADLQSRTNCGKVSDSFRSLDGPKVWKKLIEVTKGRKGFYRISPQAFHHSQ